MGSGSEDTELSKVYFGLGLVMRFLEWVVMGWVEVDEEAGLGVGSGGCCRGVDWEGNSTESTTGFRQSRGMGGGSAVGPVGHPGRGGTARVAWGAGECDGEPSERSVLRDGVGIGIVSTLCSIGVGRIR